MAFDLTAIMDGLASATGVSRAYGYPRPEITPPCVVVGYPSKLDYDLTFHANGSTGKVEAVFPVWYVVADVLDKAARDALSPLITGAGSIKAVLDGAVAGYDVVNTIDMTVETFTIGAMDYLAARFDVEVIG